MEQDTLYNSIIDTIKHNAELTEVTIAPELERPNSFLKLLDALHYNWTGADFRKVFGMRFKVKLPPIDQLNIIAYPQRTRTFRSSSFSAC